jgi:hypothetical protein
MERYHDIEQPSSYCIDSKYTRIDDMERYHDSDYTSSNDNEVQVSSYASSYGTDFDYNDMVGRHYFDYNSDDMVENVYDHPSIDNPSIEVYQDPLLLVETISDSIGSVDRPVRGNRFYQELTWFGFLIQRLLYLRELLSSGNPCRLF